MSTLHTVGALLAVGFLTACGQTTHSHSGPVQPSPRLVGDPLGATNMQAARADEAIVDHLATVQCDREEACGNVGEGQKYTSRRACIEAMLPNVAGDLAAYTCPVGIDRDAVVGCVLAIRGEGCDKALDTIARVHECRARAMCLKYGL